MADETNGDATAEPAKKSKPADTVKPESLEWALNHLLKTGDSDLVPVPFEYEAIKADWAAILPKLLGRDLTDVQPGGHQTFLVPKPEGAFRVVTRLDPIDALLYTAAVYECALTVEKARAQREIACSYRIEPEIDGRLFSAEGGWETYVAESTRLAAQPDVTYILTADISDFYSQVSHHRVGGSLEGAGVPRIRAQSIEKMLGGWSALQSRGVPVGPYASIVLAEAVLIDVDAHLATSGYQHVRYVDDFRIFCRSYSEALRAQHDLSEFLYTAHRLALNANKTRTYKTKTFVDTVLDNPAFAERDKKLQIVKEAMASWAAAGYTVDAADVAENVEDVDVLVALFAECIEKPPLRLGLARYLFRRAAKIRTNQIQSLTLASLEVLTPIFREVLFYLGRSKGSKNVRRMADAILALALTSDVAFMPVVQEWVVVAATSFLRDELTAAELLSLVKPAKATMGLRGEAMLALARKDPAWIRARKETWRSANPWERRAIIAAGAMLPGDERSAWKKSVMATKDLLDHAGAAAGSLGRGLALRAAGTIEKDRAEAQSGDSDTVAVRGDSDTVAVRHVNDHEERGAWCRRMALERNRQRLPKRQTLSIIPIVYITHVMRLFARAHPDAGDRRRWATVTAVTRSRKHHLAPPPGATLRRRRTYASRARSTAGTTGSDAASAFAARNARRSVSRAMRCSSIATCWTFGSAACAMSSTRRSRSWSTSRRSSTKARGEGARKSDVEKRRRELFRLMSTRDVPGARVVPFFNGGLFTNPVTLPLGIVQLAALTKAGSWPSSMKPMRSSPRSATPFSFSLHNPWTASGPSALIGRCE